jgi:hypothetical protein
LIPVAQYPSGLIPVPEGKQRSERHREERTCAELPLSGVENQQKDDPQVDPLIFHARSFGRYLKSDHFDRIVLFTVSITGAPHACVLCVRSASTSQSRRLPQGNRSRVRIEQVSFALGVDPTTEDGHPGQHLTLDPTTSADSERLLIAPHRQVPFRVTDSARTPSEELVNPASAPEPCGPA